MTVNAGFTTAWVLAVAGILLATGWKRQLLDDVSAPLAVLAAAVLAACGFGHTAAPKTAALICACALLRGAGAGERLQAIFGALSAGFVWSWLRKLYAEDPVFIIWDERLDGALAAGVLAAAASGRFRAQFAAVTLAAIAADRFAPAPAGAWGWLDGLTLSLLAARTVTLLARGGASLAGRLRPQA